MENLWNIRTVLTMDMSRSKWRREMFLKMRRWKLEMRDIGGVDVVDAVIDLTIDLIIDLTIDLTIDPTIGLTISLTIDHTIDLTIDGTVNVGDVIDTESRREMFLKMRR